MNTSRLLPLFCLSGTSLFALTASDDASNYGGGWTSGTNFGSGFTDWFLTSDDNAGAGFAGSFVDDSTDGAGDINTGTNQSFGLFANSDAGATSSAIRSFSSALSINDQFEVDLALNFDNGNKGFNLRNGGTQVFGFNVGGGAQINTAFTNNATTAIYDYGDDAMLHAVIKVIGADTIEYEISRISNLGTQGVLFAGSITGITNPIDNVEFYITGTDDGDPANNFYFNSLIVSEVPELSSTSLLLGIATFSFCFRRRNLRSFRSLK